MTTTMRAVVLEAPGSPEALQIPEIPIPTPRPGWVLIRVRAFGLNRSELHTRLGLAEGVTFPRVLGIEATGIVTAAPGGEFAVGQQVATMMAAWAAPSTADMPNTPACLPRRSSRFVPSWIDGGEAQDLPAAVLQSFLDAVAAGRLTVPLYRAYTLDEIRTAHANMEANNATGKLVVVL